MKRFITIVVVTLCALSVSAQNLRRVEGVVQDSKGVAIANASLKISGTETIFKTNSDGTFSIDVPSIASGIVAETEIHKPKFKEIDGTYMVFYLSPRPYKYTEKGKAEQARLVAEKEAAEKAKAEKEAAEKAKAEKEAAEKAKAEKEAAEKAKAEKEAAEKAKAEKEAAEKAKAEKEAAEKAKAEKEAAEKAKAEEQKRIAEQKEAARKAQKQAAIVAAEKRRKEYSKEQKGFGSVVDLSYMSGLNYPFPSLGISYTAGYRFNNQIYLGAGAGANFNTKGGMAIRAVGEQYSSEFLNPSIISIPVFAYFRANFIDRRCSPFFAVTAGGNISSKQTLALDLYEVQYNTLGGFVNPQLGVNFRTTTKTSLYLAVGFQCFTAPSCIKFTGYNAMLRSALGYGLDLHFGLTF